MVHITFIFENVACVKRVNYFTLILHLFNKQPFLDRTVLFVEISLTVIIYENKVVEFIAKKDKLKSDKNKTQKHGHWKRFAKLKSYPFK